MPGNCIRAVPQKKDRCKTGTGSHEGFIQHPVLQNMDALQSYLAHLCKLQGRFPQNSDLLLGSEAADSMTRQDLPMRLGVSFAALTGVRALLGKSHMKRSSFRRAEAPCRVEWLNVLDCPGEGRPESSP